MPLQERKSSPGFHGTKKQEASRRVGTLPWIIKFETTALLAPDSFSRKHEKWKRRKHQCLFADVLHGTSCGWLDVLDKEKSFSMGFRAEVRELMTKPPLRGQAAQPCVDSPSDIWRDFVPLKANLGIFGYSGLGSTG